jgi:hypothetical protein
VIHLSFLIIRKCVWKWERLNTFGCKQAEMFQPAKPLVESSLHYWMFLNFSVSIISSNSFDCKTKIWVLIKLCSKEFGNLNWKTPSSKLVITGRSVLFAIDNVNSVTRCFQIYCTGSGNMIIYLGINHCSLLQWFMVP